MAYIDPDGMFGGDRMAMLSDSARFAWPWFWCASNTCGRVELDYRGFLATVFRQFKKPPTEKQFWDWVSEFHECFLLYVYRVEFKVWGQWYVSEKYLPKYKAKADERTPPPTAREWMDWVKKYTELKEKQISGKCRVLSVSEKFEKSAEDFPVGEIKEEELKPYSLESGEVEGATPSLALVAYAAPAPQRMYGKEWFDEQHERWYKQAYWNHTGKSDSRKAYEKRIRLLVHEDRMTFEQAAEFLFYQALEYRKRFEFTQSWSWRCNLHPATWLNKKGWEDEANKDPPKPPQSNLTDRTLALIKRRVDEGRQPL